MFFFRLFFSTEWERICLHVKLLCRAGNMMYQPAFNAGTSQYSTLQPILSYNPIREQSHTSNKYNTSHYFTRHHPSTTASNYLRAGAARLFRGQLVNTCRPARDGTGRHQCTARGYRERPFGTGLYLSRYYDSTRRTDRTIWYFLFHRVDFCGWICQLFW